MVGQVKKIATGVNLALSGLCGAAGIYSLNNPKEGRSRKGALVPGAARQNYAVDQVTQPDIENDQWKSIPNPDWLSIRRM